MGLAMWKMSGTLGRIADAVFKMGYKILDEAYALKAEEEAARKKKTITETAVQDLVEDTHYKGNVDEISVEEDNTKVKVYFKEGPMEVIGVNTGDGTLHLASRENNNTISSDDLRTNYFNANVDVMLCMDIYKIICDVNNKEYDLEYKYTPDDFVNEHRMHLYFNSVGVFGMEDSKQTDMTKDGSFWFMDVFTAPTYDEFLKTSGASGRK